MSKLHQILALWPSRDDLAQALRRSRHYANQFARPDRIPTAKHDLMLWRDAQERGLPLTLDEFIAAREEAHGDGKLPTQEAAE